jgi:HEAT repeat protein
VRDKAATALGELAPNAKGAVAALTEALDAKNDLNARSSAAFALAKFGTDARPAMKPLLDMMRENEDKLREGARQAIVAIGPDAVPGLIALVKDKELREKRPTSYSLAGFALVKIGKPAVAELADALKDPELFVRIRAADLLGLIGPDAADAVPQLTDATEDPDKGVSRAASEALKKIKN